MAFRHLAPGLLAAALAFGFACGSERSSPVPPEKPPSTGARWDLCGPASIELTAEQALARAERTPPAVPASRSAFLELCKTGEKTAAGARVPLRHIEGVADHAGVLKVERRYLSQYAWAATVLSSDRARAQLVQVAASDAFALWLNGKLVTTSSSFVRSGLPRPVQLAGVFTELPLKAGENLLVMQVFTETDPWSNQWTALRVALSDPKSAAAALLEQKTESRLLAVTQIPSPTPQGWALPASPEAAALMESDLRARVSLQAQDSSGQTIPVQYAGGRFIASPARPGVVHVRLSADGRQVADSVLLGEAGDHHRRMLAARPSTGPDGCSGHEHLTRSLDQLIDQRGSMPEDRFGRTAALLVESFDTLGAVRPPADRTVLRTERSAIDGACEPYALFTGKGAPRHLVLVEPRRGFGDKQGPQITPPARFMWSEVGDIWRHEREARQVGAAVLWVRARNQPGALLSIADVRSTIQGVARQLAVPAERVVAMGAARGGSEAMLMTSRFPDLVSRCVAFDPTLELERSCDGRTRSSDWRTWLRANSVEALGSGRPCLVMHDREGDRRYVTSLGRLKERHPDLEVLSLSVSDGQDPLQRAYRYLTAESTAGTGSPPRTIRTSQLKFGSSANLEILELNRRYTTGSLSTAAEPDKLRVKAEGVRRFALNLPAGKPTARVEINDQPVSVSGSRPVLALDGTGKWTAVDGRPDARLRKNAAVEGPLADAFARRFITVPVGVSEEERKQNLAAAERLSRIWQRDFETPLPLERQVRKRPAALDPDANIVLIGCRSSEPRLKELLAKLPISCDGAGVTLLSRAFAQPRWVAAAIFPSPLNRDRYVAVFSAQDPADLFQSDENPALEGFYDFRIASGGQKRVIDLGYFDESWTRPLSLRGDGS